MSYPRFTVPVLFLANKNNAIYGVKISCVSLYQGRIEDFWKRYKWGSLCWSYQFFFIKYPLKWNNLISLRTNYLVFIGYFKIHPWVVFKITASLRRFLWAPTTYVLLAPLETSACTIKWWFRICPNGSIYLHCWHFVYSCPVPQLSNVCRWSGSKLATEYRHVSRYLID